MIYNQDFVWIHFPKAAGTKIESIFKRYFTSDSRIHQDQVGEQFDPLIKWHDSIADRQKRDPAFTLGKRRLIVCTRRLPAWLKSRFYFEVSRSPQLRHNPELLLSGKFHQITGNINHADNVIRRWIPAELRQTHPCLSYLRTEDFANDFKTVFGQFLDISKISRAELEERVNISNPTGNYNVDALIAENINSIYKACPLWSELEIAVYGSLSEST
jgi:hypothetical protein